MGMFDYVVVLDNVLRCPHGHAVDGFQTKSFEDPSMTTYLIDGSAVHRVERAKRDDDNDEPCASHWQLHSNEAVYRRRHAITALTPPSEIVFYSTCSACEPVLVRSDRARASGDLVDERRLWVEFRATFDRGNTRRIECISGTRGALADELRADGLRVLGDEEPLAIAHREVCAARERRAHAPRTR